MQETPAVQATQDAFPLDIRSAEAGIVRLVAREGLHAVIEIVLAWTFQASQAVIEATRVMPIICMDMES